MKVTSRFRAAYRRVEAIRLSVKDSGIRIEGSPENVVFRMTTSITRVVKASTERATRYKLQGARKSKDKNIDAKTQKRKELI